MGEEDCSGCSEGGRFVLPITMAFQPIVDVRAGKVFAHEALVRGVDGRGAAAVLAEVSDSNRYAFDQRCRTTAIELASRLDATRDGACLAINFLPNAVYEPRACIRQTLITAARTQLPLDRIIFEFIETEKLDANHVRNILAAYRDIGFRTAIDDFGSGYSDLGLLSRLQPDFVKLDMQLVRGIDHDRVKRTIVHRLVQMLVDLGIVPICEGVETLAEFEQLRALGVELMQGFLFARPSIRALPDVQWPQAVVPSDDQ